MYVPTQPLWKGPEDHSLTKCIAQYLYKNIYRLKTGLPIVSSLQSSVLLVTPGRELSKADIPTPNILADPSHLQNKRIILHDYLVLFLDGEMQGWNYNFCTWGVPCLHTLGREAALDKCPQTQEVLEVGHQSIQIPTFRMILAVVACWDLSLETFSN